MYGHYDWYRAIADIEISRSFQLALIVVLMALTSGFGMLL